MADLDIVSELQDYLIAQDLGQLPGEDASTDLPSIWLNPRDGAPIPRAGENITVTLRDTLITGEPELEAWLEQAFVDVIVRSRSAGAGKLLQRRLRDLLAPIGELYGRKDWDMGPLHVEYSRVWRGDQPTGQDNVAYDRTQSFLFGVKRSALTT